MVLDVVQRLAPVLAFLVALTVLAELADKAEVFDVVASRAARVGGGSARRLFLWVAVLATVMTTVLSLDTTAVLLTPVALALAAQLRLPALPFAVLTVWLANTASLLLPISNLTNLLAQDRLDLSATAYAARLAVPALTAVVLTVVVLAVQFRVPLRATYAVPPPHRAPDRVLAATASVACLAVVPGTLLGLPPWTVALPAAGVLVAVFAWRRPGELSAALLPWRLCVLVLGLSLALSVADRLGLDEVLRSLLGSDSLLGSLRTSAVSAGLANGVNNLPAYLGLESALPAGDDRLLSVLLGVNLGPLVLVWGSLATLLWRERCRARGLTISARQFALQGLTTVPVVLGGSVVALHLTR